jgi:epoxyqueuosine reductase QueG
MAKKTTEERAEELLAKLEAREAELDAREKALQARAANERGGGSQPRPHQAVPEVRAVVVYARAYLRANHWNPGARDLQLIESVAHALYASAADARKKA